MAYWAARRSMVTGVEAQHRRAAQGRVTSLVRLEEAITAVLDFEEPVDALLAGHLHVARARLRLAARDFVVSEAAPRGRPMGWRVDAERTLQALGLRRSEARPLLASVERLVEAHPVRLSEAPPLRVAFRAPETTRAAIIRRLPLPTANK